MRYNRAYQIVLKELGNLLSLMGFIFIVPVFVGFIYGEWYSSLGFLISAVFSFLFGKGINFLFRNAIEPQYNHGYIIAALAWLFMTMLGGLPFFVISYITPFEVLQSFIPADADYTSSILYFRNPLHCLFESMSAYTTTGLTMSVHEPSIGKTLLFYRSFAQWIGGSGFIVLALTMVKHISGRSLKLLYRSESTGINLRNKVIDTAKGIWKSYAIITGITVVYLIIGTWLILPEYPLADNVFDAINHAMCGLSSGGFSTLDDSIAGYHSAGMEMLLLLPMIFGSFSLPFYFRIFYNGKINEIWRDIQTRSLLICFFFGSLILSVLLTYSPSVQEPFREGVFQYISAISTTGWQTSNIHLWDDRSFLMIIFGAMVIGGAWGGTVGGLKIYRVVFLLKGIRWHIKKSFFSPNMIKTMKFDQKVMMPDEINEELNNTGIFALTFLLVILISTFLTTFFLPDNYTFFDALFESVAAQSTAGLSVGITDPGMHPVVEIIYIIQMWVGRLEIFPVLALFRFAFFGANPKIP